MDDTKRTTVETFFSQIPSVLGKTSFFVYIFFIFVGTSRMFQELIMGGAVISDQDIVASNPLNQFVFSFLYILSFFSLFSQRNRLVEFIKTEKFFGLFILWSFLSIFWSDFPFVSFKRWLQYFGTVIIFLGALLHFDSVDDALDYFRLILVFYIPITLATVILVPGGTQASYPGWTGLTTQKNVLGQISLISLIVWAIPTPDKSLSRKATAMMLLFLSIVLLIGSRSITCILTGTVMIFVAGAFKVQKVVFQPIVGKFLSLMFVFLLSFCLLAIVLFNFDMVDSLFALFGKDMTLTGRIDLWDTILIETKKNLLQGCGFGGFWVVESPTIDSIYNQFTWLPNRAHLGYLDILNETGIIGLLLFGLMIFYYFWHFLKFDRPHYWKWFVIAILVLNIAESTLIVQNSVSGIFFTFAYLAFYTEYSKMRSTDDARSYAAIRTHEF